MVHSSNYLCLEMGRAGPASASLTHVVGKLPTVAYVTAKPGGRYEIRETRRTPSGPRATTLATFTVLNDEVLEQARSRALGTFDTDFVRRGARRLGAPLDDGEPDRLARQLLTLLAQDRLPSPGLRRALVDALAETRLPSGENLGDLALWIGASEERRAEALVDLLELADAIPTRRPADELTFPKLDSVEDRG